MEKLIENKNLVEVSVDGVHENPKNTLDTNLNLDVLKDNIAKYGILHPITVYADTKHGTGYIILSGHKRFKAAKELGYRFVPVSIVAAPKDDQEEYELLLAGNISRTSPEEIESLVNEGGRMWDDLTEDEKNKVRPLLCERYKLRTGAEGIRDFRPRNEYIRHVTGITTGDRKISQLLNEGKKNDEEESEVSTSKEPKEKKKKNFGKISKSIIITLQQIVSEGADEVLDDKAYKDIEQVISILSKYMPID